MRVAMGNRLNLLSLTWQWWWWGMERSWVQLPLAINVSGQKNMLCQCLKTRRFSSRGHLQKSCKQNWSIFSVHSQYALGLFWGSTFCGSGEVISRSFWVVLSWLSFPDSVIKYDPRWRIYRPPSSFALSVLGKGSWTLGPQGSFAL